MNATVAAYAVIVVVLVVLVWFGTARPRRRGAVSGTEDADEAQRSTRATSIREESELRPRGATAAATGDEVPARKSSIGVVAVLAGRRLPFLVAK